MDGAACPYLNTACSIVAQFILVIAMVIMSYSDISFQSPGGRLDFAPASSQSARDGLVMKFEDTGLKNIQIVSITVASLLLADGALDIWDSIKERNTMLVGSVGGAIVDDRLDNPFTSATEFWASPQVKEAWMRFQFVIGLLIPCAIQYATPPTPKKVFILHACLVYNHVTIFAIAQFAITDYFDRTFTQRMRTFAITVLFIFSQLAYGFCAYYEVLLLPTALLTAISGALHIVQVCSCYCILFSRMKRDRHRYEWQNWATFLIYTSMVLAGLILNISIAGRRLGIYLNYTLQELYLIHSLMIVFAIFIALLPVRIARQQAFRAKSKINNTRRLVDNRVAIPLRAMQHALQEMFTSSHSAHTSQTQTLFHPSLVSNMTPTQLKSFAEIVSACDAALRSLEDVNDALTLSLMRDDVATVTSRESNTYSNPSRTYHQPQPLPQPQDQPLPQPQLPPPRHPFDTEWAAARNFPANSIPLRSALKRSTQPPTTLEPTLTSVSLSATVAAAAAGVGSDQRMPVADGHVLATNAPGLQGKEQRNEMGARRQSRGRGQSQGMHLSEDKNDDGDHYGDHDKRIDGIAVRVPLDTSPLAMRMPLHIPHAVLAQGRTAVSARSLQPRADSPPSEGPDTDTNADTDADADAPAGKAATIRSEVSHDMAELSLPTGPKQEFGSVSPSLLVMTHLSPAFRCRSSPLSMSRGSDPIASQLMRTSSENDREMHRSDHKGFASNQASECSSLSSYSEVPGSLLMGTATGAGWKPRVGVIDHQLGFLPLATVVDEEASLGAMNGGGGSVP